MKSFGPLADIAIAALRNVPAGRYFDRGAADAIEFERVRSMSMQSRLEELNQLMMRAEALRIDESIRDSKR